MQSLVLCRLPIWRQIETPAAKLHKMKRFKYNVKVNKSKYIVLLIISYHLHYRSWFCEFASILNDFTILCIFINSITHFFSTWTSITCIKFLTINLEIHYYKVSFEFGIVKRQIDLKMRTILQLLTILFVSIHNSKQVDLDDVFGLKFH